MRTLTVFALLAAGTFSAKGFAADQPSPDFDFGRRLMAKGSGEFPVDDLMERLVTNLEANPKTKVEAALLKAEDKRRIARMGSTSVERRNKLLKEADDIYNGVQADADKSPLKDEYTKAVGSMPEEIVGASLNEAKELDATDKVAAAKKRSEAASKLDGLAVEQKKVMEAAQAKFDEVFKKYNDAVNSPENKKRADADQPPVFPPDLMPALGATFDKWIEADVKYISIRAKQLECYGDGDAAKATLGDEMIKHCQGRIDHEALTGFPVVVGWYNYLQGKIYATLGNDAKAQEAWQAALNPDAENLTPDQKGKLKDLKKGILNDIVRLGLKAAEALGAGNPKAVEKYDYVVDTIDSALTDADIKAVFDTEHGKEILISYLKALYKPADAQSTERIEKCFKRAREWIERANKAKDFRWVNGFSIELANALSSASSHGVQLDRLQIGASEWYDAARGAYSKGYGDYRKSQEADKEIKDKTEKKTLEDAEKKKLEDKSKECFKAACEDFDVAVSCYRRAIKKARAEGADPSLRLTVESKAWAEMAQCYLQMKLYYEAVLANKALIDMFNAKARPAWLPDANSPQGKAFAANRSVQDQLTNLDTPNTGLLAKALKNLTVSLGQNEAAHKNREDIWNRGFRPKIMGEFAGVEQDEFGAAQTEFDNAKANADTAKAQKDAGSASDAYKIAFDRYLKAADLYTKVKPDNKNYEYALYYHSTAIAIAQEMWATGKISKEMNKLTADANAAYTKALEPFAKYEDAVVKAPLADKSKEKERANLVDLIKTAREAKDIGRAGRLMKVLATFEKDNNATAGAEITGPMEEIRKNLAVADTSDPNIKSKELAQQALDGFQKYETFILNNKKDDLEAERNKLKGAILLARANLALGTMDWENVLKFSDDYIAWEGANTPPVKLESAALFNKFRAQLEMAAKERAPANDKWVNDAEDTMKRYKLVKPGDEKMILFMNKNFIRRLEITALQLAEAKADPDKVEDARKRVVEAKLAMALGGKPGGEIDTEADLGEYYAILGLLIQANMRDKAIDWAQKMILTFDKDNKYYRINDDPKVWTELGKQMKDIIALNDRSTTVRCRDEHDVLVDLLFDTRDGMNLRDAGNVDPAKLPANDKLAMDLNAAKDKIRSIRAAKDFKGVQTDKPQNDAQKFKDAPYTGMSYLQAISEEIDFRQRMETTRDKLFKMAMDESEKLGKDNSKKARVDELRKIADDQLTHLTNIRGKSAANSLLQVRLKIAAAGETPNDEGKKKLLEAQSILENDVFGKVAETDPRAFEASYLRATIFFRLGLYADAVAIPNILVMGPSGFKHPMIKELWPEMKDFMKKCYELGGDKLKAQMPPLVKKRLEESDAPPKKEEPKKEEPKAEEPKKEEPKAEEPKKEEPKKTEEPKKDDAKKSDEPKKDAPKKSE